MTMRFWLGAGLSAWLLSTAALSSAQAPAGKAGPTSAEVQRRLRLLRAWEITRALQLDGEAAGKVLAVFAKTDERRAALFDALRTGRATMTRLLRARPVDGPALQAAIDAYAAARLQMAELNEQEFRGLRGLLTPEQQAKYLLAKRRFAKRVQQMLQQVKKR